MKTWIDGRIVDTAAATVNVTDHGLLYGDGIFEGIRVVAGRVFRIDRHLARLQVGAKAIGLELPRSPDALREIVEQTARAHGQREAYVRLVITRGVGPLGVDPTTCERPGLFCIVGPIRLFSDEQRKRGLDLITSSHRRPNADALDMRVKSLNYLGSALAKLEARQRGADDALLLNARGHVAEASVANVFTLHGDVLSTPPATDGCLEGINRAAVMQIARSIGLDVRERSLGRLDFFGADEVFLTGSGAGVIAMRSLDGRTIGAGEQGPVTARLTSLHRRLAETEGSEIIPASEGQS
ncbi:branched-chain amino acid aminotransferase [Sorangium cellulosum]|uniref:Branched-chain-amino-acid aminotransferase n=1 Tax=Sorangium cellulosum TaxID=56 RepID=A0A2L0EII1_SORCE|nr:branched-chain-amino-acid transaminase [Sorangium cellulosum]AUX39074.1 branched-chain amino acid aminotransferase [Sorangium cellulosum]